MKPEFTIEESPDGYVLVKLGTVAGTIKCQSDEIERAKYLLWETFRKQAFLIADCIIEPYASDRPEAA